MSELINAYISFRYPNWTDYARHQCKVQHLEGWADDLMNDIIADLLKKPEMKIEGMISRITKKIVNGRPTTELDKFVLTMIKINAQSHFASFRKNTVGQKILAAGPAGVEVATFCELTPNIDEIDECTYSRAHANKLDRMHLKNIEILELYGYSKEVLGIYVRHFMQSEPARSERQKKIVKQITTFLTENSYANKINKNYSCKCRDHY